MGSDFLLIVHLLLLAVAPPFFLGVIAKTKAFLGGRKGPPLLQAYYDIFKLLRKGSVFSRSSSALLRLVPAVVLSSILFATLFVPLWGNAPLHFEGDLVLFAYLLALARFATILAAMDVGSSFGGMGASREASFGALTELAFFLGLVVLAVKTRSTSLTAIFAWVEGHPSLHPALLLLFVAFFLVLLAENCRIPIDDPSTHLELTMIHEVMVLDYGGPNLGIIQYAASVKLFAFMLLTISLLWPQIGIAPLPAIGWILLKGTLMAVAVGITESVTARLRLIKIPQLLTANFVIVALALLVVLIRGRV